MSLTSQYQDFYYYKMHRSTRNSNMSFDGLSTSENDFLITRLDPFHDTQYNPTGGPGSAPTVVRLYRRTATFTGLTSTNNWSLCVANGPNGTLLTQETTGLAGLAQNECAMFNRCWDKVPGNAQRFDYDVARGYGGVNSIITYSDTSTTAARGIIYPIAPIYGIAVNQPTFQASTTVDLTSTTAPVVGPPLSVNQRLAIAQFGENVYTDGPSKLIAVAYEIHMTSSDLYNQGTLTIGRVPQALQSGAVRYAQSASVSTNTVSVSSAVLPSNSGELILFNGARQWPAKYGAYVVAPQSSEFEEDFDPNPFVNHNTRTISWAANRSLPSNVYSISNNTSARDAVPYLASTEHFDTVMCILEGLHPQSTITVTTILTYETIPTDSTALRPLARMPQRMRPSLQEQYARICQAMEPFSMVADNNSGRFFSRIKSLTRSVIRASPMAADILSAMPSPAAQAVAKGINKMNGNKKATKGQKAIANVVKAAVSAVSSSGPPPNRPPPKPPGSGVKVSRRKGPRNGQFTAPRSRGRN